jgi:YbbR domain-containing protein
VFRWLINNLGTLALSLVLALFVWFVAVREANPIIETVYAESIPIQLLNQPLGTLMINTPERVLRATVRGPKTEIDALSVSDFEALIDLSSVALGGADVPVVVVVKNPLVSLMGQSPSTVYVQLEEYRRLTLPVDLKLSGVPSLGYIAGDAEVEPFEVTVEGAASKVSPIAAAQVELNIEGISDSVSRKLSVRLSGMDGRLISGVTPNPSEVLVTVPVTKSDEYAQVLVTANLSGSIASGYRLAGFSVIPDRVMIRVRPEVISTLPASIQTEVVDISGASGDLNQRVGLLLPHGVSLVQEQSVLVVIDVEPVLTTLTIPWRIRAEGPDPGLTATLSLQVANIGLVGPLMLVNEFDPERHIDLFVNLGGLNPGTHEVQVVALSRLAGIEVLQVVPPTIKVEIAVQPTPTPTPTPEEDDLANAAATGEAAVGSPTPAVAITPVRTPVATPRP